MPETRTVKGFSEDGLPFAEGDFEFFAPILLFRFFHICFRMFCPQKIRANQGLSALHTQKTLIFQWVQVKTKNAPILAFMLEFVLELLEKC